MEFGSQTCCSLAARSGRHSPRVHNHSKQPQRAIASARGSRRKPSDIGRCDTPVRTEAAEWWSQFFSALPRIPGDVTQRAQNMPVRIAASVRTI